MALIVEDGTGRADAESFASVATADTYHAGRGNGAWSELDTSEKEIALRNATDYLQQRYSGNWKGCRLTSTQALDWPRYDVCLDGFTLPSNAVPIQVQRACCELALKSTTQALTADESAQVKSETVGPIAVVYADNARQQTRFAAAEGMVGPLLQSYGGSIRIVRS